MAHESFERREEIQEFSNRSVGVVFAIFFGIVGLFPVLFGKDVRMWALVTGGVFLAAGLAFPLVLAPVARLWFKLGLALHRIVNPLILGVMFFLVITPTGILMRALGKDPLRLRLDRQLPSYWIDRQPPGPAPESLKDQF